VHRDLNLHGRNHRVVVVVSLAGGHYRGSASVMQSNFGISPIRIAGGTVKVQGEVKIEFDIVPSNVKQLFLDSTAICTSEFLGDVCL
jgi:hypothetical protein